MAALYFFEYTNRSGVEHPVHFRYVFSFSFLTPMVEIVAFDKKVFFHILIKLF